MARNRELIPYVAPLPDHVDIQPGQINGPALVLPIVMAQYSKLRDHLGVVPSPDCGATWACKAVVAQEVKAYAAKNGNNPVIANANLATISRWVSWASRKLGIARSQQLAAARQAMIEASSVPDPTPAE